MAIGGLPLALLAIDSICRLLSAMISYGYQQLSMGSFASYVVFVIDSISYLLLAFHDLMAISN